MIRNSYNESEITPYHHLQIIDSDVQNGSAIRPKDGDECTFLFNIPDIVSVF